MTTLGKQDLAVTTGSEGSVGLSGATLGGGFGFLTRYLGMACDSLMAAEIVVASGADGAEAITADLDNNPDLLFALRGAGNGNFGIVTSLTYRVAQLTSVAYLQATGEGLNDLPGIFGTYQRTAPFADNRFAQAFGGAVRMSEPPGGTAFPYRDALFYAEPGAGWGTRGDEESGEALTPRAQAWIAEFSQALRPFVNGGAYVNVPNIGMQDWETAYWGPNFDRLRKIKTKYDPQNIFQYEQSIPPCCPADRPWDS